MNRRLRYAMVGGGRDAFIGAVHRHAMALDGQYRAGRRRAVVVARESEGVGPRSRPRRRAQPRLVAGAARPTSSCAPADERIDLVVIVTPNHVHHEVASGVCRRRLSCRLRQAAGAHERAGRRAGARASPRAARVFGVTYNYTGYPMVRQAREMVKSGALGADPQGDRRVPPGLACDAARGRAQQAGRLAHRPGKKRHRRCDRRHRLACREPRRPPSPASRSRACAPT